MSSLVKPARAARKDRANQILRAVFHGKFWLAFFQKMGEIGTVQVSFSPGLPENRSRQGWRPRRGDFLWTIVALSQSSPSVADACIAIATRTPH